MKKLIIGMMAFAIAFIASASNGNIISAALCITGSICPITSSNTGNTVCNTFPIVLAMVVTTEIRVGRID